MFEDELTIGSTTPTLMNQHAQAVCPIICNEMECRHANPWAECGPVYLAVETINVARAATTKNLPCIDAQALNVVLPSESIFIG